MCAQRRLRSACTSTQSNQSLHCPPEDAYDHWLPVLSTFFRQKLTTALKKGSSRQLSVSGERMYTILVEPLRGLLIVLEFNDTSTLEGHFVSSPREREKRDRRESRGDEREGQGRKRNRNESEETEEIKTFPLYPYPLQGSQALPNCKPISVGRPGDVRYTAPSHHPTTPA